MTRLAILVSGKGRGSNMQAIIEACKAGIAHAKVAVVIGAKPDAPALQRAAESGVETLAISPRGFESDTAYGEALISALQERQIDLVCLAGYMRLLPPNVVEAFRDRCMNIHPALLPFFGGPGMYGEHVHKAVLASGMKISGCTVHFVDERYDHGAIILQTPVPVEDNDDWQTLAHRVLESEHATYVRAVALYAAGRIRVVDGRVMTSHPAG